MQIPTSAIEIARFLIWLAANDRPDEPMYLTHLQLEKLLFYVQGWSLVERDAPMFAEPLEAWRDGAVVEVVYEEFKAHGKRPIVEVPGAEPDELIPADKDLVRSVWNRYKRYSALGLSDLVHEDQAWLSARGPLGKKAASRKKIRTDLLRRSFGQKVDELNKRLSLNWARMKAAAQANTQKLTGKPVIGK